MYYITFLLTGGGVRLSRELQQVVYRVAKTTYNVFSSSQVLVSCITLILLQRLPEAPPTIAL